MAWPTLRQRDWIVAGVAAVIGLYIGMTIGRIHSGPRVERKGLQGMVSLCIRWFYSSDGAATSRYALLRRERPDLFLESNVNRGAECLWAIFGDRWKWSSDCDDDGIQEACDPDGAPMLFFAPDILNDRIMVDSRARTVHPPPYFSPGFMIIPFSAHCWDEGDQRVLAHENGRLNP